MNIDVNSVRRGEIGVAGKRTLSPIAGSRTTRAGTGSLVPVAMRNGTAEKV
jgi:hypothetical protein